MLKNFSYFIFMTSLISGNTLNASSTLKDENIESYKKEYAKKYGDQALKNFERSIFWYAEKNFRRDPDIVDKEIKRRYDEAFSGLTLPENVKESAIQNGCFK